ncbi:MAG: hypothetical protein VYE15_05565 [Myxococcota bacterium]|nr:hypothetical protein [Myxococcota bacterium]
MKLLYLVIATTGLLLVGGCAHQAKSPGADSPVALPTYPERVMARLEKTDAEEVHLVRYNPTPCGCPPHEIQLDGLWHRVQLNVEQADDPVLLALQQAEETAREQGELRHHTLQGQLNSDLSTCGRGAVMVHLNPTAFGAPELEESVEEVDDHGTVTEPVEGN